jgi:anti-sigma factor RsiW
MTIPDEEVFAFVDGKLSPEAMARIESAMAGDPRLALRVETQRQLRRLLAGAPSQDGAEPRAGTKPAKVIAFPPPQPKAKPAARTRETPKAAAPRSQGQARPSAPGAKPGARLPAWAGMALVLLAGLAIGRLAIPLTATVSGARTEPAIATGPLAKALDTLPSGQPGPVRIGSSVQAAGGAYCRTFKAPAGAGVACREARLWRVQAIGPAGSADGAMPEAVAAVIAAIGAGPPLDPAAEARAIKARWKVAKPK